ncbi:hypothetical protein M8J76_004659 [Diaphorina citri]|nr:hypothetical protein M8J76_004659 [Diaphorina citri]
MSNPCTIPVKEEDPWGDNLWMSQHEQHLLLAKESEPDVIFIGDTVLNYLGQTQTWRELFEPLHCINFSIGFEKIQNTLWRIEDVVILVGSNNVSDSPENIADGIIELVRVVQSKLPSAYIVLTELLPRGRNRNPLWEKFFAVNKLLKDSLSDRLSDRSRLEFISHDISDLVSDDRISAGDFFDFLRLTESGSRKVFGPIHDIIVQLLSEDEKEKDLSPVE